MSFLDEIIKNADDVLLSRANKDIRPNSALRMEVDHLLDNGYKWSDDMQTKLVYDPD